MERINARYRKEKKFRALVSEVEEMVSNMGAREAVMHLNFLLLNGVDTDREDAIKYVRETVEINLDEFSRMKQEERAQENGR